MPKIPVLTLIATILALSPLSLPRAATAATVPSLTNIFGSVPGASGYRYNAHDSAGHSMDTAKMIVE